jgi:hypothetical protein
MDAGWLEHDALTGTPRRKTLLVHPMPHDDPVLNLVASMRRTSAEKSRATRQRRLSLA